MFDKINAPSSKVLFTPCHSDRSVLVQEKTPMVTRPWPKTRLCMANKGFYASVPKRTSNLPRHASALNVIRKTIVAFYVYFGFHTALW